MEFAICADARVGIYIELVAVRQHIEILRNRIISILRSKNIEFAIGKHIDKRKYIYGQCSKIRKLLISSITTAKGKE